jgi:hypothetical protein
MTGRTKIRSVEKAGMLRASEIRIYGLCWWVETRRGEK